MAQASRARIESFNSNNHLLDLENIFTFPTKSLDFFSQVTFESGLTTATNNQNNSYSVGLYEQQNQNSNWVVALGRQNQVIQKSRAKYKIVTGETYDVSNNSIHLIRSFKSDGLGYSLGLYSSERRDLQAAEHEISQTLLLGLRTGHFTFSLEGALKNEMQSPASKLIQITNNVAGSILYEVENLFLSAQLDFFTGKQENSGLESQSFDHQLFTFAFSDLSLLGSRLFFYRIDVIIENLKYNLSTVKERSNKVPLTLGFETPITNYIKVRSAVTQTFLISNDQDRSATENNTLVSTGLEYAQDRFKLEALLDGLTSGTANQKIDSSNLFSRVSVTYLF